MDLSENPVFDIESFLPEEGDAVLAAQMNLDDYIRFSSDKSLWDFLYIDDADTMRVSNQQALYDVEDVCEQPQQEVERMEQWRKEDPNTQVIIQGGMVFRRGEPLNRLSYSYPALVMAWAYREEFRHIQAEREHLKDILPESSPSLKIGPRI